MKSDFSTVLNCAGLVRYRVKMDTLHSFLKVKYHQTHLVYIKMTKYKCLIVWIIY